MGRTCWVMEGGEAGVLKCWRWRCGDGRGDGSS